MFYSPRYAAVSRPTFLWPRIPKLRASVSTQFALQMDRVQTGQSCAGKSFIILFFSSFLLEERTAFEEDWKERIGFQTEFEPVECPRSSFSGLHKIVSTRSIRLKPFFV